MTRDEHERERRAFWDACFVAYAQSVNSVSDEIAKQWADSSLAERDKRWPAPDGIGSLVSTVKRRPEMPEDKP